MSLLPGNATEAERSVESVLARMSDVPAARVLDVWSPQRAPAPVLPWLAWALSVDDWDEAWPEDRKRTVVARSIEVHRIKGTFGAVRLALDALDLEARVVEWHREEVPGAPFTFRLLVEPRAAGATLRDITRALGVVDRVKSLRSHLASIAIRATSTGGPQASAILRAGHTITLRERPPPATIRTA